MLSLKLSIGEPLESRVLLSAAFASLNANGTLSVVGTGKNNSIVVDVSGSKVRTTRDGSTLSFNKSSVKGIWINAFAGDDRVQNKTAIPSTLIGAAGKDSLTGGSNNDLLDGAEGPDTFVASAGHDSIAAGQGPDTIDYSARNLVDVKFTALGTSNMDLDAGFGTIRALGNSGLHINGSVGNDSFIGAVSQGVVVDGAGGKDYFKVWTNTQKAPTVFGGAGNDTIFADDNGLTARAYGGSGNDLWLSNQINAFLFVDGGSGIDTQDFASQNSSEFVVTQTMSPGVEIFIANPVGGKIIGNELNNTIIGGPGNDTIIGNGGNDSITGGGGDDSIEGNGGNDSLAGGDGKNSINGGSGTNWADYSSEAAGKFVVFNNDQDTRNIVTKRGGAGIDTFAAASFFRMLATPGADDIVFFPNTDGIIDGGKGGDEISAGNQTSGIGSNASVSVYGGDGDDKFLAQEDISPAAIFGGKGNDYAAVQIPAAIFDGQDGFDTIDYSTQSGNENGLFLYAGTNEKIIGAGENSKIIGNEKDNVIINEGTLHNTLMGMGGNDLMYGSDFGSIEGEITNYFQGGDGNDTMFPSGCNDDYRGGSGVDLVDYSAATGDLQLSIDEQANDSGGDGPFSNIHADVEIVAGGSGNDRIIGNPFANRLIGNGGNDTIFGGEGNDTLIGGPGTDVLDGQGGTDVIQQ